MAFYNAALRTAGVGPRYNIELDAELFTVLNMEAKRRGLPVADLLRQYIKLGLTVSRVQDEPDGAIIIRQGDRERQLATL